MTVIQCVSRTLFDLQSTTPRHAAARLIVMMWMLCLAPIQLLLDRFGIASDNVAELYTLSELGLLRVDYGSRGDRFFIITRSGATVGG